RQETIEAITADSAGQVWVAGEVRTNGLLTIKCAANGTLLWARRFDETNVSTYHTRLAIDPVGNAYVTTGIAHEHILIKYSPHGEELWVRRYCLSGQYV